jgi:hypothetical protein
MRATPITVAVRSKACIAFAPSNTGIVSSNPIRGMDSCVRLFFVCAVLCAGSVLGADPPSEASYRLCKKDQGIEKAARVQQRAVEP